MSVDHSKLGTQPVGEAAEVAEGVYQLKVPVPLRRLDDYRYRI